MRKVRVVLIKYWPEQADLGDIGEGLARLQPSGLGRLGMRTVSRLLGEQVDLGDALIRVIAEGPEPVDGVRARPGEHVEVREDEILNAIEQFGIGPVVLSRAELLRERCAHLLGELMARRGVSRDLRGALGAGGEVAALACGVERTSLVVGVEYLLLADVVRDRRTRDALRHDLPAPVLLRDHVVLGVLVAEPLHHLRMCGE